MTVVKWKAEHPDRLFRLRLPVQAGEVASEFFGVV